MTRFSRVTLFLFTIILISCSEDFFSASSDGETTILFTFYTTDEDDPSGRITRAINSDNESIVKDVTVFIFDSKKKFPTFFLDVCKCVIRFVASISNNKSSISFIVTINHVY